MVNTDLIQYGRSYLGLSVIIFSGFVFPTEESWLHSLSCCMMDFYRNSVTGFSVVMVWSIGMTDSPHE